jgi:hypothetical protein
MPVCIVTSILILIIIKIINYPDFIFFYSKFKVYFHKYFSLANEKYSDNLKIRE